MQGPYQKYNIGDLVSIEFEKYMYDTISTPYIPTSWLESTTTTNTVTVGITGTTGTTNTVTVGTTDTIGITGTTGTTAKHPYKSKVPKDAIIYTAPIVGYKSFEEIFRVKSFDEDMLSAILPDTSNEYSISQEFNMKTQSFQKSINGIIVDKRDVVEIDARYFINHKAIKNVDKRNIMCLTFYRVLLNKKLLWISENHKFSKMDNI